MRKQEYVITDENYYEFIPDIGSDVVHKVIEGLSEVYTAIYKPVPEPNYLAYNLLSISMFFDTAKNRLFLTYRLDDARTVGIKASDKELYNRIYDKVYMITKEQDIKLSVIGVPTSKPEYSDDRSYGITRQNSKYIKVDTESMWSIKPGPKELEYTYFIQNDARLKDDIRKKNLHPKKVDEYFDAVNKINNKYLIKSHPEYDLAFNTYKKSYKHYFDTEPKEIEDWRAFTIYIDITHNVETEQSYAYDHDYGKVIDFYKVEEYIKQWGRDHGRYVPN